uniref:Rab-like protein 6 n=1 Tax=Ditylenchus dipsaci TaxID=166011 RepID=A0A915CN90_9BILA
MITALKKKFGGPNSENPGTPAGTMTQNNLPKPVNNSMFPSPSNISKHRAIGGRKSPMTTPAGVNVVSAELQKKFAHGVNFNMKVIIRGDRNSGKTSLWRRLQGHPFDESYCPTQEIQVANITWNYRTFDHIVKLDIWDVVDEGVKKRQPNQFLKLENNPSPDGCSPSFEMFENAACDASIVDVYKNCNGVLLLFDVTKAWTWGYVQRELDRIPSQIPVLIMANKVDLHTERQVREEECLAFLQTFERKPTINGRIIAPIRYSQCSMKSAQGLKFLYNFFNVPFLFLQREYLETALEANSRDLDIAQQELDLYQDSGASKNFANKPVRNKEDNSLNEEAHMEQKIATESSIPSSYPSQPRNTFVHKHKVLSNQIPLKESSSKKKQIFATNKFSSGSNSSGDDNKMVDMYEEDFDSTDEIQQSQPVVLVHRADKCSPQLALGDLHLEKNLKTTASLESPGSQIDAWFSSANTPTEETEKPKCWSSADHTGLKEQISGTTRNPLVAHFSDNDGNSSNSDAEMSDETPSNTYTVESSTSCSTTGFTHVVSPNTKKSKQLVSSSSTLTSISGPKEGATLCVKPKVKKAANPDVASVKKKRKSEGKKTKKSATKDIPASNLLSEDLDFSIDQPNASEMYDPL